MTGLVTSVTERMSSVSVVTFDMDDGSDSVVATVDADAVFMVAVDIVVVTVSSD